MNKIALLFFSLIILFITSCQKDPQNNTEHTTLIGGVSYDNTTGLNSDNTSMADFRDSSVYAVVQLGNQYWMAENLNYNVGGSWLNPSNPTDAYGRLYDWTTVMNGASSSSSNPSGVQGICPNGWHLPSDEEWNELEISLGMATSDTSLINQDRGTHGTGMKSVTGWNSGGNGTDSSGFNAFPAGAYNGSYILFGDNAAFWSATEIGTPDAWSRMLTNTSTGVNRYGSNSKSYGLSCRCLKD
ncbi:FISUMP domain-containing protein [Aureispira anguillae]|uniref:Fibrobacter succinogenes major paralogous domain-containing protein n=1 Tax=Aureispira anguillae TaxID=2864201 RepID=A0A915YH81_9BACT|nr:FISUMP domain-containing protein [Aureispira anguillae]BDS13109.1 hypothetical protein AsAng_0038370 [Aureispira anguillae]